MKKPIKILNRIVDKVLAYKPKPKKDKVDDQPKKPCKTATAPC